jgi:uncharacterized protein
MAAELELRIAGEPMRLYADRALYWPARQRLLIADLHLGKGDIFRRAGIAVPHGGTAHDLDRLDRLIAHSGARELWILGDVLHGIAHRSTWHRHFAEWRAQQSSMSIAAIIGNHDRHLGAADLGIELLGECVVDPPFLLCHAASEREAQHVISGHLHPALKLPGMRRRWPAFWLQEGSTVLPAFSAFTGSAPDVDGLRGRWFACVDNDLVRFDSGR